MQKLFLILMMLCFVSVKAQVTPETEPMPVYQASATRVNDLVHTRLEVTFDYNKSYLLGKVWITLKPHFNATDSVQLDAKGMDIQKVFLVKGVKENILKYKYDGFFLTIKLDKVYTRAESYVLHIDYVARPNEMKFKGSASITDAKGLYFINPKGEQKDKPTQVWTQGETEGTSVWCPTIDRPNQKCTSEITMTVQDKYVTLSNGRLESQKKNDDGTRTDHWVMDLPHSPYLFFMGIGEYAVVKDNYKGKEVNYYVEKEYEPVARKIFGFTPEMMAFYERITGVAYPWVKYSQMTARDYVSGAMENTTATLHDQSAQQDARELIDENRWESTIAHELFHQWFGDYVTAESWSNLTVNESFAEYSQYLWKEYKHGADEASAENYLEMQQYLSTPEERQKKLVRFYYDDKEDMFDLVSYQKGACILHMLRQYVGDSAFFQGLHKYLVTNKFSTGEAHQLRLALEDVSGLDLNWFFNQWYFGSGHPIVDITYDYNTKAKKVSVTIKQMQGDSNLFRLRIPIDIYNGSKKVSHLVWLDQAQQTFTFSYTVKPDLINVDGDKFTLWQKTDIRPLETFIHQYYQAGNYVDRREAVVAALTQLDNQKALDFLMATLKDKSPQLRLGTLRRLDLSNENLKKAVEPVLNYMANNDPSTRVMAEALSLLSTYKNPVYASLFKKHLNDSSYSVAGAALKGLAELDKTAALAEAKKQFSQPLKGELARSVTTVLMTSGDDQYYDYLMRHFENADIGGQFEELEGFAGYVISIQDFNKAKRGIDLIANMRESIPVEYRLQYSPMVDEVLKYILNEKKAAGKAEWVAYIQNKWLVK